MRHALTRRAFPLLIALAPLSAGADDAVSPPPPQEMRYELGIGLGAVDFPVYSGAAERRTLVLPFPYFTLRSRFLDADRGEVRGKLFRDDRWALDVDFGGNIGVNSSDTRERQGMPDLEWLGEVGPALRYHIWHGGRGGHVDFVLPARIATSVHALTFHRRGYDSDPRVELDATWFQPGDDRVTVDANLAARFVDRAFADYYYSVAPQYATAERRAYSAPGGYAGWSTQLGVSWHRGAMVYGAFVEHSSLHGAAFQASPLVGSADGWSFGLAVAWVIHRKDDD